MGQFFDYHRDGSRYTKVRGWLWPFTGQHTNPHRNQRRAKIAKAGGIRQFKRQQRAARIERADHG